MIITILSDLGINNPYHAMGEAIIAARLPMAKVIYISQQITPFSITQASYFWRCTKGVYDANTFHISLVDTISSMPASVMHTRLGNNYYIGMDNGLLTASFGSQETSFFISKHVLTSFSAFMHQCCTDIEQIIKNGFDTDHFLPYTPSKYYNYPKVLIHPNAVECAVVFVDKYDNIVTNLHKDDYDIYLKDKNFTIHLLGREKIHKISEQFESSESGGLSAYFNEFGYLQISMRSKGARTAATLGYVDFNPESRVNTNITIFIDSDS